MYLVILFMAAHPAAAQGTDAAIESRIRDLHRMAVDKDRIIPALNQALSALRRAASYEQRGKYQAALNAKRTAWAALELASRQTAYEAAQKMHKKAYRDMSTAENDATAARQALESALYQRAHKNSF